MYEEERIERLADVKNLIKYSAGELEDIREGTRCVSEDKNKTSKMKSIWCVGRGTGDERGAEKEIRTSAEERWRACLIYAACVRDNRKVKGYSRGLEGGGERKQSGLSDKVSKERMKEEETFLR